MTTSTRAPLIDTLRGLALLGIVVVNIHSFVFGMSTFMLGMLAAGSTLADHVTVVLTAFFAQAKFYPIFCFCFGYGFAVQTRQWLARGLDASALFGRRLQFMLMLGVLHGGLIWFGDILTAYALIALVLQAHIGKGPKSLARVLRFWAIVAIVAWLIILLMAIGIRMSDDGTMSKEMLAEAARSFASYQNTNWGTVALQRLQDYFTMLISIFIMLPQVMLLFLLGALVAQMGWLRDPVKHRHIWQRVLFIGVAVGVPLNIGYTFLVYGSAIQPSMASAMWAQFLGLGLAFLSAAYVAVLALTSANTIGRAIIRVFAPLGRFALTNYIMQSVVLSTLLYGYGAGLGKTFSQADLGLLALALFAAQLLASHLYARTGLAGPLEALWRRYIGAPTKTAKPRADISV